jgi:uncharacterized protein (TIGR03067 family)
MRRVILATVVVGLLLAAGALRAGDEKKEKERLQGAWRGETAVQDGKDDSADAKNHVLIFDGDNFRVEEKGRVEIRGTFKINPSKKPAEIDLMITEGSESGETAQGIYVIEGDMLRWCTSHPGVGTRPKEFASPAGSKLLLVTLKREKK